MHEDIYKKLEDECRFRNHTEKSIKQYLYHTRSFLNWIGDKPIDELTLNDARDYIMHKRSTTCSAATCNGINTALSYFYRVILRKVWVYEEVPRMKQDWKLPTVCTQAEIEKLIDTATNIRNKAIIALIYSSGLRVGEVCRLAPTDIYMSSMQVHVRKSKNHGDHWTILSERALELLKAYWYAYPEPRDVLFVSLRRPHRPLKPGGVEIMLRKIADEAGVTAHPHTLRHSFATHLIEDDTRRESVQAMLGHKSPASTAVYVHVSNMSLMGVTSPLDRPPKNIDRKPNANTRRSTQHG